MLLATSGLRICEALHLTLADVNLTAGVLPIHQPKFRKSRLVPVSAGTLDALRRCHDRRVAVAPADLTRGLLRLRSRHRLQHLDGPGAIPRPHRANRARGTRRPRSPAA